MSNESQAATEKDRAAPVHPDLLAPHTNQLVTLLASKSSNHTTTHYSHIKTIKWNKTTLPPFFLSFKFRMQKAFKA